MGRGRSKAGGGGGGKANTPSGFTQDDLLKMPEAQRVATINNILASTIQMPDYLDGSDTSKVIYALGMDGKPKVVSDSQLDAMQGTEIFRTVYESGTLPPPSSKDILDQIKYGDYTQLSGKGGSAHGRALYFATRFSDSASYGRRGGKKNAQVARAKIDPNAKVVSESTLQNQMRAKGIQFNANYADQQSLYAITQGIDGWYSYTYTMMVNRGVLTASSQNKTIRSGRSFAYSWAEANKAK